MVVVAVAAVIVSHAEELRNLYAEEAKVNAMAVEYQNLKHKFDTRYSLTPSPAPLLCCGRAPPHSHHMCCCPAL